MPQQRSPAQRAIELMLMALAAFCTYFCMYAFRKPFTAATFEGQEILGLGLKTVLVISQLAGYMLSKFIGIRAISELRSEARAPALIGLILFAEAALVGFAFLPAPWKVLMLFLNGLPLGLVFGLVMAYLEGRRQSEALAATLCASFIIAAGFVKSVGRWLIVDVGFSDFQMPMVAGCLFFPPLLAAVWLLQRSSPPNEEDRRLRSVRGTMNGEERAQFLSVYGIGLSLLILVYVALTVLRTIRDDFAVEIWNDLQSDYSSSVFTWTETVIAILATVLNGMVILIVNNLRALRVTFVLMGLSFALAGISAVLQLTGSVTPFLFMVLCGTGLYIPYVAFHTTIFERLIAASRRPCNLGFLMYVADSVGYLGYAVVVVIRASLPTPEHFLPFFVGALCLVSALSIVCLTATKMYFDRKLSMETTAAERDNVPDSLLTLASPPAAVE